MLCAIVMVFSWYLHTLRSYPAWMVLTFLAR